METKNTIRSVPIDLLPMNITFTSTGLDIVKAYRDKLASETGRKATIAKAVDALVKSHPFVQSMRQTPP